jgi:hypothetical protein
VNALRRFLWAVKGVHVIPAKDPDDAEPFEGRGIGAGTYPEDAAFMRAEAAGRFHADIVEGPQGEARKRNIITTSRGAEGPAFHAIDEPGPEPEPEKLSLRDRWRRLKAAADELKKAKP